MPRARPERHADQARRVGPRPCLIALTTAPHGAATWAGFPRQCSQSGWPPSASRSNGSPPRPGGVETRGGAYKAPPRSLIAQPSRQQVSGCLIDQPPPRPPASQSCRAHARRGGHRGPAPRATPPLRPEPVELLTQLRARQQKPPGAARRAARSTRPAMPAPMMRRGWFTGKWPLIRVHRRKPVPSFFWVPAFAKGEKTRKSVRSRTTRSHKGSEGDGKACPSPPPPPGIEGGLFAERWQGQHGVDAGLCTARDQRGRHDLMLHVAQRAS